MNNFCILFPHLDSAQQSRLPCLTRCKHCVLAPHEESEGRGVADAHECGMADNGTCKQRSEARAEGANPLERQEVGAVEQPRPPRVEGPNDAGAEGLAVR